MNISNAHLHCNSQGWKLLIIANKEELLALEVFLEKLNGQPTVRRLALSSVNQS